MQKSKFIDGAVVKNSDMTIVKHMLFENRPSKTHGNINISCFIHGAVVKKSHAAIAKHGVFEN